MSNAAVVRPILRWAGSKKKLLPKLVERSPRLFCSYYEPFAGSSILFLALNPARAVIADLNAQLIDTYATIRDGVDSFCDQLDVWPSDGSAYYEVRALNEHTLSRTERAARFLYLNRFCFNGVFRTNKKGQFNVARGSHTGDLPTRVELSNFAARLDNADLRPVDFNASLCDVAEGDFVYLDPPYAMPGKRDRGEYGPDSFRESDMDRLVALLNNLDQRGAKVLLSYADHPRLREELGGWVFDDLRVARSVAGFAEKRARVAEVLVRNYRAS